MADKSFDDLQARHEGILRKELSLEQLRFQTVSFFLAAVGLIIGLSPK